MVPARMGVAVFHYEIGDVYSAPTKPENLILVLNEDGEGN